MAGDKEEGETMSSIMEFMLKINRPMQYCCYHKDTDTFDGCPVSAIQMKTLDRNAKISMKDDNNFPFLSYEEIDHEEIMRFYVREYVEDKEIRKKLFYILRRDNYIKPFIEELQKLDLYDDFDMACGDVYEQIFLEWAEKNGLDFRRKQ